MLILCVPEEMNRTEEISLLLQKIPDNTNPTGLKFKYFCVLQVIAGSIHNVDKEQSRRKRKMISNSIGQFFLLKTLVPFMSDTILYAKTSFRKASHSKIPHIQFCIIEQLFLIIHQYFISFQTA